MKKLLIIISAFLYLSILPAGCTNHIAVDTKKPNLTISASYAEGLKYPPSYAVWIEDEGGNRATLYVTSKAGTNKWGGAERPSVLPIWSGLRESSVDSVSQATPSKAALIQCNIPQNFTDKKIKLSIEANASFDYNAYYRQELKAGEEGFSDVNGQPSLLWETELNPSQVRGEISIVPAGTGDVLGADHAVHNDLSHLTTANNLLHQITVQYDFIK